jgi:hypothetical protein
MARSASGNARVLKAMRGLAMEVSRAGLLAAIGQA